MPKYRYLALAAAGVMVLAPAGAAYATSAHNAAKKPVLTLSKVGGKAVSKDAKVTAGLAKDTTLKVSIGAEGTATCKTSAITAKVTANPNSKGKAALSLTGQTVKASSCKITVTGISGLSLKSMTAVNLPYGVTVSASKGGGKVSVTEASSKKPLGLSAAIEYSGTTYTCVFTAKSVSGTVKNKNNTVAFSKQPLSLNTSLTPSASLSVCEFAGKTAAFSATYGPLKSGSKKVFVS